MEDKKFIKHIQEKLSHHRLAVPDELWNELSDRLPIRRAWYKRCALYAAAAAIVGLIILAGYLYNDIACFHNHDTQLPPVCCNNTQSCSSQAHIGNTHTERNILADTIQHKDSSTTSFIAHNIENNKHIEPTATKRNTTTPTVENVVTDTLGATIITTTHLLAPDSSLIASHTTNEEEQYYDNQALESICKKRSDRDASSFFSFEATTSASHTVVTPFSMRCKDAEVKFSHNMPFAVRALFEKRFGKWGVGIGLSYTYMTADYEMSYDLRQGEQQLHYVGIPLYASFEFARVGQFAFYTSLGGEIDINTAGFHQESPDSQAYEHFDRLKFRDKKLQFSTQLRLGVAYECIEHLDIFVEPVLGYYFDNNSKVHSMWQDVPLNVSVALGVRTWF